MATTTADGLPVPVIDDSPDVPRDFLALAAVLGPELVQKFTTTGQRDTAFATVPFTMCNVAGIFYQRVGSAWVQTGGLGWGGAQVTSTTAQGVSSTGWTILGMNTSGYSDGDGFAASGGGQGILCTYAGRVRVDGMIAFQGSSVSGRRGVGVGLSSGSTPIVESMYPSYIASADNQVTRVRVSDEITVAAGAIVSLMALQDSIALLPALNRSLTVRRVG